MQGRMFVLAAALSTLAAASAPDIPQQPGAPESGTPTSLHKDGLNFQVEPAPDWLVWRAFHERLKSHSANVPGGVNPLLKSRLGIDDNAVTRFMELGEAYLQEILRQLTAEKTEVRARSMAATSLAATAAQVGINEILERDGSIARFEAGKNSALEDHKKRLADRIGPEGIKDLKRWLDAEVKNQIRYIKANPVPSPVALQQGAAPVVPTKGN